MKLEDEAIVYMTLSADGRCVLYQGSHSLAFFYQIFATAEAALAAEAGGPYGHLVQAVAMTAREAERFALDRDRGLRYRGDDGMWYEVTSVMLRARSLVQSEHAVITDEDWL